MQGNVQVPVTGQTVGLDGAVSPLATPTYVPGSNALLDIAQGLQSLNPALSRIGQEYTEKDRKQALLDAKAAAERDAIDKEKMNLAQPDTTNVPWAVRSDYVMAYKNAIADKAGAEAEQEMYTRFQTEHTQPDFNFGKFVGEFKAQQLAGVQDSAFVVGLGARMERASEHLSGQYRAFTQKRLNEESSNNLALDLGEVTPGASPASNWTVANAAIEKYVTRGGTRAEGVKALFDQTVALSVKSGGDDRLFDVFHEVNPTTGLTMAQMNPGLADNIEKAVESARKLYQRNLDNENFSNTADIIATHQEALKTGKLDDMSYKDVADMIRQYEGPTGVYRNPNDRAQFMDAWLKRQQDKGVQSMSPRMFAEGTAHMLPEKEQKAGLALYLATPYARLQEAIANNGTGQSAEPIRAIVNLLTTSHVNVADEQLQRMVESVATEVPREATAGPSARFNAAVEFYQALRTSANPGLASMYFKEDARHLMDTYLSNYQGAGMDNVSAYQTAYKAISPESKAAVEVRLKDPAVVSKIHSEARGAVTAWYERVWAKVPFTNTIDSTVVEQGAEQEARRFLSLNPQADKSTLNDHLERWSTENFYRDPGTNSFIRMPPGQNDAATQKALSSYLDMVTKSVNVGDQDRGPRVMYAGEGKYEVVLTKPAYRRLGLVEMGDIRKLNFAMTNVNDEERAELGRIKEGLVKGTVTAGDLQTAKPLLDKARAAGMWDGGAQERAAYSRTDPGTSPLYTEMVKPLKGGWKPTAFVRPDSPTTRGVVEQFMQAGSTGAALTAMAEGVRLTAYNDPAVGRNIGIGYNLDKNSKTIAEDFRKAGIPPTSVEGVVAGSVAITPQQAMRLYDVVRPRYEQIASTAVEKRAPGEWDKLPKNAKEVLIDMAYQAGNKVGDFEKGINALIKGDLSGAGLEMTYVDRKTKTRKVDERRHTLRTALLSSTNNFQTVINHASRLPANAYEARIALR